MTSFSFASHSVLGCISLAALSTHVNRQLKLKATFATHTNGLPRTIFNIPYQSKHTSRLQNPMNLTQRLHVRKPTSEISPTPPHCNPHSQPHNPSPFPNSHHTNPKNSPMKSLHQKSTQHPIIHQGLLIESTHLRYNNRIRPTPINPHLRRATPKNPNTPPTTP